MPDDPNTAVWHYALTGDHLFADRLSIPNQRGWFAESVGESIVVIDVDDEAGAVSFRPVDGGTGVAGTPTPLMIDSGSIDLQAFFGYDDGKIILGADRRVFVADVTTGELVVTAP